MTKRNLLFIILIALLLAGCTSMVAPQQQQAQEIDLLSLPDDIDVDTVAAIKDMDGVLVLDVREQYEYDEKHIPGVKLIPLATVPNRLDEIPTDQTIVVTCRSGNRSNQAAEFLRENGYTRVHNMTGGINDWEAAGYPVE